MVAVGGNLEQKPIGLKFGVSGTHNNTELVNGKVQLKKVGADWDNSPIYADTGTWTSDIIDIGDNFADFGKVFTSNINQGNSSITIETRTSSNGTTFDEWKFVDSDGTILSQKNKYIQVRVNFFVDRSVKEKDITNFDSEFADSSNGIKLKIEYSFNMMKDELWSEEGSLHKKQINVNDWLQVDKLDVLTVDGNVNKSLILHDGKYKKWDDTSWQTVSSTLPTSTQFLSDGMNSLSPMLDREVMELTPQKMSVKSDVLQVREVGKVFSKTVDLNKYFDLRQIRVEVEYV